MNTLTQPLRQARPTRLALAAGLALLAAASLTGPPPAGVLLLGLSLLFAGVLRWPDVSTYVVLFLLYSNLLAVSVAFHGVPKPVAAVFPLLLLVPLSRDLLVRRLPLVLTPAVPALLLLLSVQALGAAFARDPRHALGATATYALEGIVLYLLLTNVLRTKSVLVGATWSLIAAGTLMSAVPLLQYVTGSFDSAWGGLGQVEGHNTGELVGAAGAEPERARLSGTIGEKNRYAQVMLVLLPLGLSRIFAARRRALRLVALGCTASITLGFVLASSRGGAIGLLCILAAMAALRLIAVRRGVLLVGGLALVLAAMPQYWSRLETIGASAQLLDQSHATVEVDGAVRRRATSMLAAVRVFLDHPWVGVGPGMFKAYSEEYGTEDALRRLDGGRRAHSLYLELAAETGVTGLCLFLAALVLTAHGLVVARRACLSSDAELADLCAAFLLGLVSYLGTGLFLHLSYMRYFFLLLAVCGAATEVALRAARSREAANGTPSPVPGAAA